MESHFQNFTNFCLQKSDLFNPQQCIIKEKIKIIKINETSEKLNSSLIDENKELKENMLIVRNKVRIDNIHSNTLKREMKQIIKTEKKLSRTLKKSNKLKDLQLSRKDKRILILKNKHRGINSTTELIKNKYAHFKKYTNKKHSQRIEKRKKIKKRCPEKNK